MNINPLLLPEIPENVLDYVDLDTLKASRLVNKLWNKEAGKILSSSSWVVTYRVHNRDLQQLQNTLATSADPALFFAKLELNDLDIPREDLIFNLFQTYGTFLKGLSLDFTHSFNSNWYAANGPVFYIRLIHRVLTEFREFSPFLQKLNLRFEFPSYYLIPSKSYPEFTAPTNLQSLQLRTSINSDIPVEFQNFLVQILAASKKLKVLRIVSHRSNGINSSENERLYQNLTTLQHMMNKLEKFTWKGHGTLMSPDIVPNIHFLSNHLKTLIIESSYVDPNSFHLMINTIGSSLKNLELFDCGFNQDSGEEFQSHLLEIVIKSLVNLETLRIGYRNCSPDHLFSNSDNLNAQPHQNLKRLAFPLCGRRNVLEVSSVSNVVKWFPNLTLLSLCFGEHAHFETTMGVGIRLQEAVGILSGLKRLTDLNLRLCSDTAPGDLQLAFKALLRNPSLLCCTFAELTEPWVVKTTYGLEDVEDELKELKHLNYIRLIDFSMNGKKAIKNFAKENGVNFQYCNAGRRFELSQRWWKWSRPYTPNYEDE